MSYKLFQKKNPSWPLRLSTLDGRKVKLKKATRTKGGTVFEAGAVMVIWAIHQGKFTLCREGKVPRYGGEDVMLGGIYPVDVELLP